MKRVYDIIILGIIIIAPILCCVGCSGSFLPVEKAALEAADTVIDAELHLPPGTSENAEEAIYNEVEKIKSK